MTSLTEAKKYLLVINNAIYYSLIVLSTSPLSFFLTFQINYCGCFSFFFRMQIVFSNKDNELQWAACVSLSV